jgi:hypothetical protein
MPREKGQYQKWSPEAVTRLRVMAGTMTAAEIARELNATVCAIRCKLVELGVSPKRPSLWSPEKIASLKRLAGTMQVKQIAAELGLTVSTVQDKLHRLGIQNRNKVLWTPESHARLREMVLAGTDRATIAEAFGCSYYAAVAQVRILGLKKRPEKRQAALIREARLRSIETPEERRQIAIDRTHRMMVLSSRIESLRHWQRTHGKAA